MEKILKEESKFRKSLEEKKKAKKASAELLSVIRAYHTGRPTSRQRSRSVLPRTISVESINEAELNLTPFEFARQSTRNGECGLKRLSSTDLMSSTGLPTTISEAEMMKEILFWSRTTTKKIAKALDNFETASNTASASPQRAFEEITRVNEPEAVKKNKTKPKRAKIKVTTVSPSKYLPRVYGYSNVPSLKEYFAVRENKMEGSKFQPPVPAMKMKNTLPIPSVKKLPVRRGPVGKFSREARAARSLEARPPWNPSSQLSKPLKPVYLPPEPKEKLSSRVESPRLRLSSETPKPSPRKARDSPRPLVGEGSIFLTSTTASETPKIPKILSPRKPTVERKSRELKRQPPMVPHVPQISVSSPSPQTPDWAYLDLIVRDQFTQPHLGMTKDLEIERYSDEYAGSTYSIEYVEPTDRNVPNEMTEEEKQKFLEEEEFLKFIPDRYPITRAPPNTRAGVLSRSGLEPLPTMAEKSDELRPAIVTYEETISRPRHFPPKYKMVTRSSSDDDNVVMLPTPISRMTKEIPEISMSILSAQIPESILSHSPSENVTVSVDPEPEPDARETHILTNSEILGLIVGQPKSVVSARILDNIKGALSGNSPVEVVKSPPATTSIPWTQKVKKLFTRNATVGVVQPDPPESLMKSEAHTKPAIPKSEVVTQPSTPEIDLTAKRSRFGRFWHGVRNLRKDRLNDAGKQMNQFNS